MTGPAPLIFKEKGIGETLQESIAPIVTVLQKRQEWQQRQEQIKLEERRILAEEQRVNQAGAEGAVRNAETKLRMEAMQAELDEKRAIHDGDTAAMGIFSALISDPTGMAADSPEWRQKELQLFAPYTKDPEKLARIQKSYDAMLKTRVDLQEKIREASEQAKIQKVLNKYPTASTDKVQRQKMITEVAAINPTYAAQLGNSLAASDPAETHMEQATVLGPDGQPTAAAFNPPTGTYTLSQHKKPVTGAGATGGGELKQARQRAAAGSRIIINQMHQLVGEDAKADDVPDQTVLAHVLASGFRKFGAEKAADYLAQHGFSDNQIKFQALADQFVHTYGGTLPGSRNQLALLRNFRDAFFYRAGQGKTPAERARARVSFRKAREDLLPLLDQLATGKFDPTSLPFYYESQALDQQAAGAGGTGINGAAGVPVGVTAEDIAAAARGNF